MLPIMDCIAPKRGYAGRTLWDIIGMQESDVDAVHY